MSSVVFTAFIPFPINSLSKSLCCLVGKWRKVSEMVLTIKSIVLVSYVSGVSKQPHSGASADEFSCCWLSEIIEIIQVNLCLVSGAVCFLRVPARHWWLLCQIYCCLSVCQWVHWLMANHLDKCVLCVWKQQLKLRWLNNVTSTFHLRWTPLLIPLSHPLSTVFFFLLSH